MVDLILVEKDRVVNLVLHHQLVPMLLVQLLKVSLVEASWCHQVLVLLVQVAVELVVKVAPNQILLVLVLMVVMERRFLGFYLLLEDLLRKVLQVPQEDNGSVVVVAVVDLIHSLVAKVEVVEVVMV